MKEALPYIFVAIAAILAIWACAKPQVPLVAAAILAICVRLLLCGMFIFMLAGCSHTKRVGKIGNVEFYKVQATSLLGPSQVALYAREGTNGALVLISQAAGNGIGPALVGAGGLVGAAGTLGATLRPDRTTVNGGNSRASSEGGEGGTATATGGSATVSPVVGPPAPPNNRPPPNRPRNK